MYRQIRRVSSESSYDYSEDSTIEQANVTHSTRMRRTERHTTAPVKLSARTQSVDNIYHKERYLKDIVRRDLPPKLTGFGKFSYFDVNNNLRASQQGDQVDTQTRCGCCSSIVASTSTSSSSCSHEACCWVQSRYHQCDTSGSSSCTYLDGGQNEYSPVNSSTPFSHCPVVSSYKVQLTTGLVDEKPTQVMNSSTSEINHKVKPDQITSTGFIQSKLPYATLDVVSLLKYRVQYPELLTHVCHCTDYYTNPSQMKSAACFLTSVRQINLAREVMVKRIQKHSNSQTGRDNRVNGVKVGRIEGRLGELTRMRLWKRRYYILLTAVEFVYKDYQLLHHVSMAGLFEFVSDLPPLPSHVSCKFNESSGRVSIDKIKDVRCLAITSADPASYLADRVTQLLVVAFITNSDQGQMKVMWPCPFTMSVSLLSDAVAQSRLLRHDLDRRLALQDRLLYVLRQARCQRAKLTSHLSRQREYCITLQSRLLSMQQRLTTASPIPDFPASINEGVSNNISSPFVEPEGGDAEIVQNTGCVGANNLVSVVAARPVESDINKLRERVITLRSQIVNLERVLKEEESRRKRLHNRIQELTGNIRVFCRLRPNEVVLDYVDQTQQQPLHQRNRPYLHVSSDDKLLISVNAVRESIRGHTRTSFSGISSAASTGSLFNYRNCATNSPSAASTASHPATVPKCFIFDRVFGPAASQDEVYRDVDDLIVSCIDGYNVCIMAYGQTGSGKTYTMMGTTAEPGVNRQAVQHLFERCNKRKNWKYSIFVSMVEIYQEDLYDLLEDIEEDQPALLLNFTSIRNGGSNGAVNSGLKPPTKVGYFSHRKEMAPWNTWTSKSNTSPYNRITRRRLYRRGSVRILSDSLDGVVLQNLQEHRVDDEKDMLQYLELAEKRRRVGSTRLNICSSRSHLVILLRVVGENQLDMKSTRGTLTLADLAGSENVTKSGSTGESFLEAACINKSLSSLGRVFDALRRQQKPTYRETKLTYLLKPNLSGESKCLLFVALRTEPEHAEETWRAVHFGQGAIQVVPGSGTACNGVTDTSCNRTARGSPAGSRCPLPRLASPSIPLRPFKAGNSTKTFGRVPSSDESSFLTQAVYNMEPAITKRGWRYALCF